MKNLAKTIDVDSTSSLKKVMLPKIIAYITSGIPFSIALSV